MKPRIIGVVRPFGEVSTDSHCGRCPGLVPLDETLLRRAFGQTLCLCRVRQGFSQRELSIAAGFDITYVSFLERGLRTPRLAILFRISETLDLSPKELAADSFDEYQHMRAVAFGEQPSSGSRRPTVFNPLIGAKPSTGTRTEASEQPQINLRQLKKSLATQVKSFRVQAALTPKEALSRGGFSAQYWSQLERGRCHPDLFVLFHIAFAVRSTAARLVAETFAQYKLAVSALSTGGGRRRPTLVRPASNRAPNGASRMSPKQLRPLKNPLIALQILEATLNGKTGVQCAHEFGISACWCNQLASRAGKTLLQPHFLGEYSLPVHDWALHRNRLLHREHWLQLIKRARLILAGEDPEGSLAEGIQGSGHSIPEQPPAVAVDGQNMEKSHTSEKFQLASATERKLRAAIQNFRASDRRPRDELYERHVTNGASAAEKS